MHEHGNYHKSHICSNTYKACCWKKVSVLQVSLQAKQLMYRLLHRDPKNRLGSHEGANEIKCHPFFRGVNWALVRCMVRILNLRKHEVEFNGWHRYMFPENSWAWCSSLWHNWGREGSKSFGSWIRGSPDKCFLVGVFHDMNYDQVMINVSPFLVSLINYKFLCCRFWTCESYLLHEGNTMEALRAHWSVKELDFYLTWLVFLGHRHFHLQLSLVAAAVEQKLRFINYVPCNVCEICPM